MSGFSADNPGPPRDRLRKDLRLIENQWQGQEAAQQMARMMERGKPLGNFPPAGQAARQARQARQAMQGLGAGRPSVVIPPGTLRNLMPEPLGSLFTKTDRFKGAFGGGLSDAIRKIALPHSPGPRIGSRAISNIIGNLPKLGDFSGFWEGVGRAADGLRQIIEESEQGELALEDAEFGFADHLWDWIYLGSFAGLPEANKHAVITNRLRAFTCSDEFIEPLLENIGSSKMLGKRSTIIERCLEAHQRREYELSIPSLMTQIEGAVGDAMFLKELVVREGNKYYLLGPDGRPKRNKKDYCAFVVLCAIWQGKRTRRARNAPSASSVSSARLRDRPLEVRRRGVSGPPYTSPSPLCLLPTTPPQVTVSLTLNASSRY